MAINFEDAFFKNYMDSMYPMEPDTEQAPEMQLASANTGVMTDGGAFVGTRLNMPKGLNTRENQAKQSVLIADTLAGGGKGLVQGFAGLPGDLESIGRMALGYLGYNVDENTALPTSEEIGKRLESVLGQVIPPGQTTGVPTAERVRAAEGGTTGGEILAPSGQVKLASKVAKPVFKATIKMLDGAEQTLQKAPKVESKAFKNWFGDSKAVDDTGKPIVVYHATREQFDEFNTTGEGQSLNTGTFFSSSPDVAGTYNTSSQHSIVPAYLSLKNPVIVEGNGANWNKIGQDAKISLPEVKVSAKEDEMLLSELTGQSPNMDAMTTLEKRDTTAKELFGETVFEKGFSTNEIARWARSKGYDGVIFKNVVDHGPAVRFSTEQAEKPSNIYVAFQPTQIKSAISNKGTFDPKDPSILKGVGVGGTGAAMSQEENK
jgi:hypothetical protein